MDEDDAVPTVDEVLAELGEVEASVDDLCILNAKHRVILTASEPGIRDLIMQLIEAAKDQNDETKKWRETAKEYKQIISEKNKTIEGLRSGKTRIIGSSDEGMVMNYNDYRNKILREEKIMRERQMRGMI